MLEALKFSLAQKPAWMSLNPDTGLITPISDGTGGAVTVSLPLIKEHPLMHDKDNLMWGNIYEHSRTYENPGPAVLRLVVNAKRARTRASLRIRVAREPGADIFGGMKSPGEADDDLMRALRNLSFTLSLCVGVVLLACGCKSGPGAAEKPELAWLRSWRAANPVWRGVHLGAHNDAQVRQLMAVLPQLAAVGVNVVVVEVDYSFDFQSHPEVRGQPCLTKGVAGELTNAAHEQGIRLIPQLNCLGHQSWSRHTGPLLTSHPEFDETPGQYPNNTNIYCRSWCPQHPQVNSVVFELIDELIDAFRADAFHVGMDEVFLIASPYCPRCRGGDPAKLFAKAVNDLHGHIVRQRKLEMLMWGDRLLDAKALGYSEWEGSRNGTQGAIDLLPKDIIQCDWHYGKRSSYPSVPLFLAKGFRVWPSGWQPLEASQAFSAFARQQKNPRMLGYLCTTWGKVKIPEVAEWPPVAQVLPGWR